MIKTHLSLVLVDGFLQYPYNGNYIDIWPGHNPYFNRWFSAMRFEWNGWEHIIVTILILIDGFLQSHVWGSQET